MESLNNTVSAISAMLTIICSAIPITTIYLFINQAQKGNVAPLKYTIFIIGGCFIITLIGYLSKKFVYDRIHKFEDLDKKIDKDSSKFVKKFKKEIKKEYNKEDVLY
jgi:hypothetical protein